jgi:hypothetical protein
MLIWSRDLTTVTKKNSSREPSDKWSPINASSSLKKFSLLEKVENFFTLFSSHQFFKFHKSQVNTEEQLQAAKQRFHHNRCKNMPTIFSPKLCVAHRLSPMQECVLVPHITCMFENMSKWGNHTFCFRNHLRCFKVKLTPCVKSTRATTTLAGLQFSTPRKDVTNRSRLMWQLIFIWQAKSAPTTQANSSTHALVTIFFIQDLSLRHYATPRRPIWQYLVRENGEVRLWEFAGDNEGVIRCIRDEMVSLPWESE